MKQNASTGEQSGAPRRRWRPGQEQHPGPENQDQHTLSQPRASFPDQRPKNATSVPGALSDLEEGKRPPPPRQDSAPPAALLQDPSLCI